VEEHEEGFRVFLAMIDPIRVTSGTTEPRTFDMSAATSASRVPGTKRTERLAISVPRLGQGHRPTGLPGDISQAPEFARPRLTWSELA